VGAVGPVRSVGRRRQHGVYGRTQNEEGHVLQFTMIATIVLIPTVAVLVWRLIADSRRYENARLREELNAIRHDRDEARAERDAALAAAQRERDRRIAADATMRLVAGTATEMNTRLLLEQHLDQGDQDQ
jgi:hypothetical protein